MLSGGQTPSGTRIEKGYRTRDGLFNAVIAESLPFLAKLGFW